MKIISKKTQLPLTTLDDIAESIVDGPFGSNLKISDYVESGVPVLQGKNITGNRFIWREVRYISEEKAKGLKRSSTILGDHLLIKIGSIGYSAILDDLNGHDFAIIPANLARLRPDRSVVDDQYLHRVLTSDFVARHFQKVASKTAQPALSLKKIKATQIPLPPLAEQKRIAAILDAADALRAKRRETLAQLDTLLQSTFLDMFGDPVTNPKGWEQIDLSTLIDSEDKINYGVVQPGDDYPSGKPLIRVGDFVGGILNPSNLKLIDPNIEKKYRRSRLNGRELLVSCVGSIGTVCKVSEREKGCNIARAVARVPLKEDINRDFMVYCLRSASVQRHFSKETRTVSQPTLNIGLIKNAPVIQPPSDLQHRFATIVQSVEQQKSRLLAHLAELDTLFTSLQSRAFNGEL